MEQNYSYRKDPVVFLMIGMAIVGVTLIAMMHSGMTAETDALVAENRHRHTMIEKMNCAELKEFILESDWGSGYVERATQLYVVGECS